MTLTLIQKQLLACLRAYAGGTMAAAEPGMTQADWAGLRELAAVHKMTAMVFETLRQDPAFFGGDREQLALWRREAMMEAVGQAARSQRITEICSGLEREGIPCALVKGLVCRSLYSRPDLRPSGDEDLFIAPADRQRCAAYFRACGLQESTGDETVSHWQELKSGLHIELHTLLLENEASDLNARFEARLAHRVTEAGVPTLEPSWHFAFLMSHALKHFLTGGVGIRTICDCLKFAEMHKDALDHRLVEELLREIHGRIFWDQLLAIGEQYLGIPPQACGWTCSAPPHPEALLLDCLEAGIYGQSTMSRRHSAGLVAHAAEQGRFSAFVSAVFPGMAYMRKRFPVLEHWPVLLPVCWLRRLVLYYIEVRRSGGTENSPLESLSMGKKRMEMMKQYGVLEESHPKN